MRRLPAASSNPLSGFQILHAFGMHFHRRHSRLHTRIVAKSNAALSTYSSHYYTLWTCRSYKTRRSLNTARCGMHLSHFSVNFCVHPWTRLHVLILLLLSCDSLLGMPPAVAPKPNLLSALVRSASTPLSTCSLRLSHSFLVTPWNASKYFLYLQASSSRQYTNRETTGSQQAGRQSQDTRTQNTLQSSRIPSNEFTTERSRWYNV